MYICVSMYIKYIYIVALLFSVRRVCSSVWIRCSFFATGTIDTQFQVLRILNKCNTHHSDSMILTCCFSRNSQIILLQKCILHCFRWIWLRHLDWISNSTARQRQWTAKLEKPSLFSFIIITSPSQRWIIHFISSNNTFLLVTTWRLNERVYICNNFRFFTGIGTFLAHRNHILQRNNWISSITILRHGIFNFSALSFVSEFYPLRNFARRNFWIFSSHSTLFLFLFFLQCKNWKTRFPLNLTIGLRPDAI